MTYALFCPACGVGIIADPNESEPEARCAGCGVLLLEYARRDDLFPPRVRLWHKRPVGAALYRRGTR